MFGPDAFGPDAFGPDAFGKDVIRDVAAGWSRERSVSRPGAPPGSYGVAVATLGVVAATVGVSPHMAMSGSPGTV